MVQLLRPQLGRRCPSVVIDPSAGIAQAVAHLAELGHRRIAYVGSASEHVTDRGRLDAFVAAMSAQGLSLPDRFILAAGLPARFRCQRPAGPAGLPASADRGVLRRRCACPRRDAGRLRGAGPRSGADERDQLRRCARQRHVPGADQRFAAAAGCRRTCCRDAPRAARQRSGRCPR